jgi:hypothetical protein
LESTFISSLAQQSNKLDNLSDLTPKDEDPVQQNEYENSQELKAKVRPILLIQSSVGETFNLCLGGQIIEYKFGTSEKEIFQFT